MEKFALTYQPIVQIHIEDQVFGDRLSIVPDEANKFNIANHLSLEKLNANRYTLGLLVKNEELHESKEVLLESDGSLKGTSNTHIKETYDYELTTEEYCRKVTIDEVVKEEISSDLIGHIFDNQINLKFYIKFNSLLKHSLFPEGDDPSVPKEVLLESFGSDVDVKIEHILITPIIDNDGNNWEIYKNDEFVKKIKQFNLDNDSILEFQINIPPNRVNVNLNYKVGFKYKK